MSYPLLILHNILLQEKSIPLSRTPQILQLQTLNKRLLLLFAELFRHRHRNLLKILYSLLDSQIPDRLQLYMVCLLNLHDPLQNVFITGLLQPVQFHF